MSQILSIKIIPGHFSHLGMEDINMQSGERMKFLTSYYNSMESVAEGYQVLWERS